MPGCRTDRGARTVRRLFAALLLSSVSSLADENALFPDADRILHDVRSVLPRDPLRVSGELTTRKRHGFVLSRLQFEMLLHWGGDPSEVRYTIRDAFGRGLEQLTVTRPADGEPRFAYATGASFTNAPLPDLYQPIQQTDVSWMDLALTFLWWKGGTVAGREKVLDRECFVLDVPAPAGDGSPLRYSSVRLWVEEESRMLFQAEGRDAGGQAVRRLWVRSFKRFDDRWMIKDMEIQAAAGNHRTKLRVQDAREVRPTSDSPEGSADGDL